MSRILTGIENPSAGTSLFLAAVTATTWGMTGIFIRMLPALPPAVLTAGRLMAALMVISPLLFLFRFSPERCRQTLKKPASYAMALLLAGYYFLATSAFQSAPVAEIALLLSTPPLFVIVLKRLFGTPPGRAQIGGAVTAVLGIGVIMAPNIAAEGTYTLERITGDITALCAAVLTASYACLFQHLSRKGTVVDAGWVSFLTFLVGGGGLCLFSMSTTSFTALPEFDVHALFLFAALGVVSTAVPTLAFAVVSKRVPAIVTSCISLFIPLCSGYFAYIILNEKLPLLFLFGSALVLSGVAVIIFKGRN